MPKFSRACIRLRVSCLGSINQPHPRGAFDPRLCLMKHGRTSLSNRHHDKRFVGSDLLSRTTGPAVGAADRVVRTSVRSRQGRVVFDRRVQVVAR